LLKLGREKEKLEKTLGGIKNMDALPTAVFLIDVGHEEIAVREARKLAIPIIAVVDTNCSPEGIDYPIPGNDDAQRAIALYCDLVAKAALDGIARQQGAFGVDIGASTEAPVEPALDAAPEGEAPQA